MFSEGLEKMLLTDIFEEELRSPTIFRDESKLNESYMPDSLPHRTSELRELIRLFLGVMKKPGDMSQRVTISGGIGAGKTALSKCFGKVLEEYAHTHNLNLHYVHVNCRRKKSRFLILRQIVYHFNPTVPHRGYSPEELLYMLDCLLESQNAYLILVLDELDFLLRRNNASLLYDLTRWTDEQLNGVQRVSLILIVRDRAYMKKLDASTLSSLQHNHIYLAPYSAPQLEDILQDRANEALFDFAIHSEVLTLIADIASERGDARFALELLWRAGKYADRDRVTSVFPEHVRLAKADIHPDLRKDIFQELSLHHRLVLLAIIRQLKKHSAAYTTTGNVEAAYNIICEEYLEPPRKHTQLWEYIKDLEQLCLITTKLSGKGMRGKTTLIGLPDAPLFLLEKELQNSLKECQKVKGV
jgi:cell division control protein 6